MSQLLVQQYLNEIDRLRKFSGVTNEQVIRPAFRRLLDNWASAQKLVFLEEYPHQTTQKTTVYPDGTVLHDIRVPLGHWEAKDTGDKLEEEVEKKFRRGYPQDNIIFENSERAILYQNRQPVMEADMTDVPALLKLLTLFFGYERQEIAEFRRAVEKFKADLPTVLDALREKIDAAYEGHADFRAAADRFLAHAKDTINPSVGEADVREMLIQHILTEEIFTHVFNEGDFHRENNIARELYALEGKFFTGAVKRETLKALEPYYAAIRTNAAAITSHSEKQTFLKVIYENFYKVYNPKAADRLGVVYTPNEIVKFMIEGADWLCHKHFGKTLIDPGVEILDPATGTGTFVTELLQHFAHDRKKLAHKYKNELHANEVAILPYYVANLNIEATYFGITGQFAEFENLCFVDTLDNVAGLGIKAGYQHDMYARFFRWASDRLHDDGVLAFITNRSFIDSRTFDGFRRAVEQEFNEIHVMDLGGDVRANPKLSGTRNNVFGIQTGVAISFFVKRRGQKGCKIFYARRPEFDTADDKLSYLGSNKASEVAWQRVAPDKDANWVNLTENDWDSLIPVADKKTKAAKGKGQEKAIFRLFSLGVSTSRDEWVYALQESELRSQTEYLINAYNDDLERFQKSGKPFDAADLDYGIKWTRSVKADLVAGNRYSANTGNMVRSAYRPFYAPILYFNGKLLEVQYQQTKLFGEKGAEENTAITFTDAGSQKKFMSHVVENVFDYHYVGAAAAAVGLPRYRYTPSGERIDNITDWALREFQKAYGKDGRGMPAKAGGDTALPSPLEGEGGSARSAETDAVPLQHPSSGPSGHLLPQGEKGGSRKTRQLTRDDIFHYVYGVLHDPVYRETYALNLKREFPRIPFYPDFWRWAEWGEKLMALHIGYETVEPWPLTRTDTPDEKAREAGVTPKAMLKADRDNGIIRLDTETTLSGIPSEAWDYRLGNRSGLDWILDQYKEKTPKDPTIREKFNTYRFANYKEKVVDLLSRVTRVSVETVAITEAMKEAKR
ncbi:MAG: N-6 DNA methylase [Rhizobiaceae bacterium]|nr:N-6 DNA methylase [Rhizobiaceae bacterium]